MNGKDNLTNVAYAKGNPARYILSGILLFLIIAISIMFINTIKNIKGLNDGIDETKVLEKGKDEETSNN